LFSTAYSFTFSSSYINGLSSDFSIIFISGPFFSGFSFISEGFLTTSAYFFLLVGGFSAFCSFNEFYSAFSFYSISSTALAKS